MALPTRLIVICSMRVSSASTQTGSTVVRQHGQELILRAIGSLRFVTGLAGVAQESVALLPRLPFRRDVAGDSHHPLRSAVGVEAYASTLGEPHDAAVGTHRAVVGFVD